MMKITLTFLVVWTLIPLFGSNPKPPCGTYSKIHLEFSQVKMETKALQTLIQYHLKFLKMTEKNIQPLLDAEIQAEYKNKAKKHLSATKAAIGKQLSLLRKSKSEVNSKENYSAILRQSIQVQANWWNSDPGFIGIAPPGGGPITIIPTGPPKWEGPRPECKEAGDRIENDCMDGLDILEECGAISAAVKAMGMTGCQAAGNAEEANCNSYGDSRYPRSDANAASAARMACAEHDDDQRNLDDPLETQTSGGN